MESEKNTFPQDVRPQPRPRPRTGSRDCVRRQPTLKKRRRRLPINQGAITSTSLTAVKDRDFVYASRPLGSSGCPTGRRRPLPTKRRTGKRPLTGKSGCAAARGRRKGRAAPARRPRAIRTYYETTALTRRRVSRQSASGSFGERTLALIPVVHVIPRDLTSA